MLEALFVRRISPALQIQLSAVSGQFLRNGGTLLGLAQYDVGKYALEGLYSSDGGLLGFRGVYNSGGDANESEIKYKNGDKERVYGRFSTGGEFYYGTLNKSGGLSFGTRFATLPEHKGTPLSATLTLTPLVGNISASYAVVAGKHCSLASRLDFNIFSYESNWAIGMELWRKPFTRPVLDGDDENKDNKNDEAVKSYFRAKDRKENIPGEVKVGNKAKQNKETKEIQHTTASETAVQERSFQAKLEWRLDESGSTKRPKVSKASKVKSQETPKLKAQAPLGPTDPRKDEDEKYAGVLKTRLDQNLRIGVLWEGRVKSLLFSLGSGIDLRKLDKPFRTLGLEIQFSS